MASLRLLKKKTSQRGWQFITCEGAPAILLGVIFNILIGFGGSFLHGGSFFMKVVHSSDERELKLNGTAVNCKHRSYNCYNCYKHHCR